MERIKFDPPRPWLDDNTTRNGVREFLEQNPFDGEVQSEWEDDIAAAFSPEYDGYDLASVLEEFHSWNVDMQLVEWLDNVCLYVDGELEKEEREWAEKNNIQPPFPVGTRVECRHGGKATGAIEGVYKYSAARYLIKIDDVTDGSMAIVKFEDCSLIQTSNAD